LRVLVADDDEAIRWVLRKAVEGKGFRADVAVDGTEALALLEKRRFAAAFVDVRMPGIEGIEVLERAGASHLPTRFVIMTAVARPETAARSTRAGASEFLAKPFDLSRVEEILDEVARAAGSREKAYRSEEEEEEEVPSRIVGRSKAILRVFEGIGRMAASDATVLLLGERGVGKELVARCIHDLSSPDAPFVAVNASAIPRELQEAELFGYEKGAFTGADAPREGKLEAAGTGTLFLDEVGDTPAELQVKLLRVLQEREFSRLGSSRPVRFRGRFVAATNRDLEKMVRAGTFRADLFDRLNVFPVRIPSLSERREDIPLLADFFLRKYCALLSRPSRSFSREALELLSSRPWKGNVRELENFVQRLAVLSSAPLIRRDEVARELVRVDQGEGEGAPPLEKMIEERVAEYVGRLGDALQDERELHAFFLRQMERPLLKVVLDASGGNQLRAAAVLGINRNTLRQKLSDLGIHQPRKGAAKGRKG
jgi:two-component system nitrogen regulation response regulator GlnG